MTKEEIFKDIQDIAVDQLDINADQIALTTNIKEDLEADSLDLFEILNELEDKYDLELDDADGIVTISDLVDFVKTEMDKK